MAISTPTNVSWNSTNSQIVVSGVLPALDANKVLIRLTPEIYSDFVVSGVIDVDSDIDSGGRDGTFGVSELTLVPFMFGINYRIEAAFRNSSGDSEYVSAPSGTFANFPFPVVTSANRSNPELAIDSIVNAVPPNRIGERFYSTGEIDYTGSWRAFPKITLTGSFSFAKIINTATGAFIDLLGNVRGGEYRVIELNQRLPNWGIYGGESLSSLSSRTSEMSEVTNLRDFYFPTKNNMIRPLSIQAYFYRRTNSTSAVIEFNNRFIGF